MSNEVDRPDAGRRRPPSKDKVVMRGLNFYYGAVARAQGRHLSLTTAR